jgi:hypothetical protein
MGVIQFPTPIPVTNGNYPQFKFAIFSDNLATVTTAGYLNSSSNEGGMPLSNADVIMALYSFNQQTQTGLFGIFTVNIATTNGQITLTTWDDPSSPPAPILPTTVNYLAHFTDTIGTVSSAAANVINAGNIQAGISGTAGTLGSFPAAATSGELLLAAVTNSSGNFNTTISNASAIGQSQVVSIPDSASTTANFIISKSATTQSITTGHLWVSAGNISAGGLGAAGTLTSYPNSFTNGYLRLAAVSNTGNTFTIISNVAMGQTTTISIPDPVNAVARFLVGATATPFVSGNFPVASGTGGLMIDSGVAATNLQNKSNIRAVTVTGLGGAGAGPIVIPLLSLTSTSIVIPTIVTSSNIVAVAQCSVSTDEFIITFTGDPGATCTISYVAFIAPQ